MSEYTSTEKAELFKRWVDRLDPTQLKKEYFKLHKQLEGSKRIVRVTSFAIILASFAGTLYGDVQLYKWLLIGTGVAALLTVFLSESTDN